MKKSILPLALSCIIFLPACSENKLDTNDAVTEEVGGGITNEATPSASNAASCESEQGVRYLCGLTNAEDLLPLGDSQWLIASGMNGDLSGLGNNGTVHLVNYETETFSVFLPSDDVDMRHDLDKFSTCPGPIDTNNFSAHGLAVKAVPGEDALFSVYMTSHGEREAIEVFEVDISTVEPELSWVGCVPIPGNSWTNSVVILEDGGFFATQFMDQVEHGIENIVAGEITGHVFEWHPGGDVEILAGTELSGANGIAISENEQTLYVAAFGAHAIVKYDLGTRPLSATVIPVPLMPDNVHWSQQGTLLTAGVNWTQECADSTECGEGWSVYEINPVTLSVERLAGVADGSAIAAASSALQVGSELWVGTYAGDRIAILPMP